jgi:hypothetical protein
VRELRTTVGQLRQEIDEIRRSATQSRQRLPLDHRTSQHLDSSECPAEDSMAAVFASAETNFVRNDGSATPQPQIDNTLSQNPLNVLYEASMRTFLDEQDIASSSREVNDKSDPIKEVNGTSRSTDDLAVQDYEPRQTMKRLSSQQDGPELIQRGIIDWEEAQDLYLIYIRDCNQHIFLLDPFFHTSEDLLRRSQFLWTVVCYVASRYSEKGKIYSEAIYQVAMRMAREVMLTSNSVETVQGLLLLFAWSKRSKKSGDQIAWMLSGAAVRMATGARLYEDLSMTKGKGKHSSLISHQQELELLDRQRTWLLCYAADRGISALTGTPPMMREEALVRNCRSWCQQKDSKPWDAGISCYVELQKIQVRGGECLCRL